MFPSKTEVLFRSGGKIPDRHLVTLGKLNLAGGWISATQWQFPFCTKIDIFWCFEGALSKRKKEISQPPILNLQKTLL